MYVDYHVHAIGHDHRPHTVENIMEYIRNARANGVMEIGFADHDRYLDEKLNLDLYLEARKQSPDVAIKIGLEIDYYPDQISEITRKVRFYDYDFLIGSVHYIGNWMFDSDKERKAYEEWDHDKLYEKYISLVTESARKDFYDILGHIDLIKIFNIRPRMRKAEDIFAPYLRQIATTGLVVEINTNGMNKPVGEIYPAAEILDLLYQNNIGITLSSDAHHPEEVGQYMEKALAMAKKAGYQKFASFTRRQVSYINL